MQNENLGIELNIIQENENSIVPLNGKKPRKNGKVGKVQIEEKRNGDGLQRKVIRDLGNGIKSVEITQVYNRQPIQQGI